MVVGDHVNERYQEDYDYFKPRASTKTALLITYVSGAYPYEYEPTVFDNGVVNLSAGKHNINLHLWDTSWQEDYDRLRPLTYANADVFLLVFSITGPWSYRNIKKRWFPEVTHHRPGVPIILVGVHLERRNNPDYPHYLASEQIITTEQGVQLAKEIKAIKYIECSIQTCENVKTVFAEAVKAVLFPQKQNQNQQSFNLFKVLKARKPTNSPTKSNLSKNRKLEEAEEDFTLRLAQDIKARNVSGATFSQRQAALLKEIEELKYPLAEKSEELTTIIPLLHQLHNARYVLTEAKNSGNAAIPASLNPFNWLLPHEQVDWEKYEKLRLKNRKILKTNKLFGQLHKFIHQIKNWQKKIKPHPGNADMIVREALIVAEKAYETYLLQLCNSNLSQTLFVLLRNPPGLVLGLPSGSGVLTEQAQAVLFSERDKNQLGGTATVKQYGGVHYKLKPHAPGVEFMVGSLANLLMGDGATPTELIKLIGPTGSIYACQASKSVEGIMLEELLKTNSNALTKIRTDNFTHMILLGLLTNPQDGKADNYMVEVKKNDLGEIEELRILGIDNDIAFVEPCIAIPGKKLLINVHNILYFFPQMKEAFDNEVRERFLKKIPILLLLDWLLLLQEKNTSYQLLLDEKVFTESEFSGDKTNPLGLQLPIKFLPGMIKNMYRNLVKIQQLLQSFPTITPQELLFEVQPEVYQYYADIQRDYPNDIGQCIRECYSRSIDDPKEQERFKQQIARGNTRKMTELVLKTTEQFGFEKNRQQPLGDSFRELLAVIQYEFFKADNAYLLISPLEEASQKLLGKGLWQVSMESGLLELASWLLQEGGASVNEPVDNQGYVGLHYAVNRGDDELIVFLLQRGADTTLCNKYNKTPLMSARSRLMKVKEDTTKTPQEQVVLIERYRKVIELLELPAMNYSSSP